MARNQVDQSFDEGVANNRWHPWVKGDLLVVGKGEGRVEMGRKWLKQAKQAKPCRLPGKPMDWQPVSSHRQMRRSAARSGKW